MMAPVNQAISAVISVMTRPKLKTQQGFTMVEILVTMVVLAVGLLGIAGLETVSMRMNQSAYFRTQASVIAQDIIGRMRANTPGIQVDAYNGLPDPQRVSDCLTTTGCLPDEMANNDAFDWITSISRILPSGQGMVCIDSTPDDGAGSLSASCDGVGDLYVAKLWWLDDRSGDGGLVRFTTSFQP